MDRNRTWVLFGLDLKRLLSNWQLGWRELAIGLQLPQWLAPCVPVAARYPDGSQRIHAGANDRPLADHVSPPRACAVCLPDEIVLVRRVSLPLLSNSETASAIALTVASSSPFTAADTLFGYRIVGLAETSGHIAVDIAIASRSQAMQAIAAHPDKAEPSAPAPEVWARVNNGVLVFRGFGEGRREKLERAHWLRLAALASCALFLLTALAATPLLQANIQVREANQRLSALTAIAAADVGARDALLQYLRQGEALLAHRTPSLDALGLLERLSALIPDDAYLTSLRLERDGSTTINGYATNAATLIDTLGREGGFTEVKSLAAISRDASTNLESFSISFQSLGRGPQ